MKTRSVVVAAPIMAILLVGPAWAEGNAKRGNDLFHKNCAACHGNGGKGDGPAAASLKPKPRDLTDKAFMATLTDAQIEAIIKKGGAALGKSPQMPALGGALKDQDVADIAAYVRSLAK